MSWETIENVAAPKAGVHMSVPPKGVRVRVRQMAGKAGRSVRYIHVSIGVALAKSLCLTLPKIGVRLSLGGGRPCRSTGAVGRQWRGQFRGEAGQGWRLCADHQRGQRRRVVQPGLRAVCRGGCGDHPCARHAADGGVPGSARHAGGGLSHG